MTDVMRGIRILEVAEHTFVPAASAILAEWGADVIKIEHVERGDAMRGLASSGIAVMGTDVHVLLEHSNRGKRSLGLDLTTDEGREVLYKLAATSDVFLTNKLPSVRSKLRIDLEDIRSANPDIVYARGSGQGENGPEADRGAYDSLAYWCRAGIGAGIARADDTEVPPPPPAFGDSIGAMTIAGGIMGALLHRERTGEATEVDVSLLAVGLWSFGAAVALSLQFGMPWNAPPRDSPTGNPLAGFYSTSDGRQIMLTCLQAARYWPDACRVIGRPELAEDPRFADALSLMANAQEAADILTEVFAQHTVEQWRERMADFTGQWAVVQTSLEAAVDQQTVANGYLQDYTTSEGTPFQLVAPPVQYGGVPARPMRAPEFNEQGDDILGEIGLDMEAIIELKVKGVVA